ncbi:MAG: peptidyl-prolyl cis-trans isomerase (rotamase) - cyclophilin family, partial [Clostridia bacterium]|nr:peptidyl-prolyl cis-trans isomerase (rotamase) - cyclophilin family [Clostridia bacterium]
MKKIIKSILLTLLTVVMLSMIVGCGEAKETEGDDLDLNNLLQTQKPEAGEEVAIMTTNFGVIKIRFFPEQAPKAVENFITHSKDGYYNGLIFHRVMSEFMIQGGDPDGKGFGGESIWGQPFEDEFSPKLKNFRGALSMANSGKNTNGSQFFIVQKGPTTQEEFDYFISKGYSFSENVQTAYKDIGGTPWLDNAHTVFGQVYEGLDVVDAIAAVKVNNASKPLEDVIIEKIE